MPIVLNYNNHNCGKQCVLERVVDLMCKLSAFFFTKNLTIDFDLKRNTYDIVPFHQTSFENTCV